MSSTSPLTPEISQKFGISPCTSLLGATDNPEAAKKENKMLESLKSNQFLPVEGEFNQKLSEFLYTAPWALDSKYVVCIRPNGGDLLYLFTFASNHQEAFQIAKGVYEASPYPKVGVGFFVVNGVCKSSTCLSRGEDHPLAFPVGWSPSN